MSAVDYFLEGNSCSESVVLNAIESGYCDKSLLPSATPFSGGMSSGCVCGTVSGSMLVIGHLYGKNNSYGNPPIAKQLAKEFMEKFIEAHKVTCCRVLTRGFEFASPERKNHCTNLVEFSSNLLEDILKKAADSVKNG